MFAGNAINRDGGASAAAENQSAKMNIVSLILGCIGFGVSLYALILHVQTKSAAGSLTCDVSDSVNCTKVIGSEYGEFMGLPLGALGMSYFGVVIAMAFLPAFVQSSASWIARRQLVVATVGAVISLYLAYISYFKLQAVCLVCTSVHALSVVNFIWTLVSFIRVRSVPQTSSEGGTIKMPALSSTLGSGQATATPTPAVNAAGIPTPFPEEWLQIARSNYVGKGEDYRLGSEQAKVVVHMFSDFECPHCKVASEDIAAAISAVGNDRVLFVYRNYPLSNKCNPHMGAEGHPYACDMAMAARCAGSQKKEAFWEYKTWAFSGIDMTADERAKQFSMEGFVAQAKKLNLDAARFESCLKDKVELAKIQEDIEFGRKMGLTGTPLIVVNGRKYSGESGPQGFARAFRAALDGQ
jgi:uncharacterized membrane protein/protein-disulfide isomerase